MRVKSPSLNECSDLLARRRVARDRQAHLADLDLASRDHEAPVDARYREVLAGRARRIGCPSRCRVGDEVERVDRDRAFGPP